MNYFIITGASKGIGKALAKSLIDKDNVLFCVSRRRNEDLIDNAVKKDCRLHYFEFDLSKTGDLPALANEIFNTIIQGEAETICLVNNAGILDPMKPLEKCNPDEIARNFNINLIAPAILCSEFIKRTGGTKADRRIINISSGAGKRPVKGWSCYGASKAGIDLFTQIAALEQEDSSNPVKIISFAPGVVDTDMQKEIRLSSREDFPDIDRFISLKKESMLLDPEYAASKIKELIYTKNFKQGGVIRIDE